MTRVELRNAALRLLIAVPLVLAAAWAWGGELQRALLPLFQVLLDSWAGRFGTVRIDLEVQQSLSRYVAHAQVIDYTMFGDRLIPPGSHMRASFPASATLIPAAVLLVATIACYGTWRKQLRCLMMSAPMLLVLESLDTPVVLAIGLHHALLPNSAAALSPGGAWVRFLDGGGRFALAIAAALFVAALDQRLRTSRRASTTKATFNVPEKI